VVCSGLKALVTGQRLKALAFTLFKPIALVSFAALQKGVRITCYP